jgi:DNA-binding NarL/FixJ family response regulator
MQTSDSKQAVGVMIIDDHKVVRSGLRMLIDGNARMKVVAEAGSREEAIAVATREQPDVILLDLVLGQENGTDLIPELLKAAEEVRILILTGLHDPREHRRAVQLGAMGVVIKETSSDLLLKAIQKIHEGEFWLDRFTTASLLTDMRQANKPKKQETADDRKGKLTVREREVITLVGEGLRNKQIADRLCISESTVRHHLTSIFEKLGVADRLELLIFAYQNGMAKVPA